MFDDNDEEFEDLSNDPLYRAEMQAMYEEELETSMRFAYDMIDEVGIERWCSNVPYGKERKIRLLENMIKWYEEQEEYEVCAQLVKGIRFLNNPEEKPKRKTRKVVNK
jgi:hypothetical protein